MQRKRNEEDAALIHQCTDELLEEYRHYLTILKPYVKEEDKEDIKKKEIRPEILKQCFADMRIAFDNLDMDQMEEVEARMEQFSYDGWQKKMFERLQSAIEAIDVDTCEDIIHTWEEKLQ